MDLHSDQAWWPLADGLLRSYPPAEIDLEVDVLVIGAGISGAFLAYQLTRAGHRVAVVDRRDVGLGSTCASTALVQAEIDTPLVELRSLIGQPRADAAYRFCASALDRLLALMAALPHDVSLGRRSTLYLASSRHDARGFPAELEARRSAGLEVELLEASALDALSGLDRRAALVTSRAAHVDPYRLTHALFAQAAAAGALIHDRTSIVRVERERGKATICAITDRKVHLRARTVAWACGYETEAAGSPAAQVDLVSSYAVVSEPMSEVPAVLRRFLIWESARPYLYVRDTADARGEDVSFTNPRRRDRRLPAAERRLGKGFSRLLPETRFEGAYAWAGTFAQTADGLPRLGFGADGREFYALGYGGNGLLFAAIAAEALVEALAGSSPRALELFPLDPGAQARRILRRNASSATAP